MTERRPQPSHGIAPMAVDPHTQSPINALYAQPSAHTAQTSVPAPAPLSIEHLFFNNLLLLGFDVRAQERKHHLAFDERMFRKTNVKGMEVPRHSNLSRSRYLALRRTSFDC